MEQDLIRERYDLSMARIQEILTEETVPENYRDYFRKVTEFIIQCGEVLKAKEDGSLDQMTLEEGRPVVDPDKCPGCGVCKTVCPKSCIQILEQQ